MNQAANPAPGQQPIPGGHTNQQAPPVGAQTQAGGAGWREQYAEYQQMAPTVDAAAVERATEEGKQNFDNGELIPLFRPTKEGYYQIRILPRFDSAAMWWLYAELYSFGPQGLPRGFSPKVYGAADHFDDFITANFPYDEHNRVNMDYRKLRPKRRVLSLVFVRHVSGYEGLDYDPGTIYVWDVPLKRSGWEDYIEPHIKLTAAAGIYQPCDLAVGYDAVFRIAGTNRDRKTMDFQFVGEPGPVFADMQIFEAIMNAQYRPLMEAFRRLTDEDMQSWREYFQPCVDMVQSNPMLHVDPQLPQCKAAAEQWVRQAIAQGGVAPGLAPGMGMPQQQAAPMPPTPSAAGAPAYQPGAPVPPPQMLPPQAAQAPMAPPPPAPMLHVDPQPPAPMAAPPMAAPPLSAVAPAPMAPPAPPAAPVPPAGIMPPPPPAVR